MDGRGETVTAQGIEKVRLGRTSLVASKLGFGTSGIAGMPEAYGYTVEAERAHATLAAIFASPVALLDTSRIYGRGRGEERIGNALREIGGLPEGYVLSTKLDRDFDTDRFDAPRVRRSLEESLAALGLERIPLLHLHDPEHASDLADVTGPGGALAELFRLKAEGLVDAVGLAAGRIDLMLSLVADWDFDVVMTHNRFTLANRNAEPLLDACAAKGIAVLNAAPYASGLLAKGSHSRTRYVYRDPTEAMLDPVRRIEEVCARHSVPTGAAALQFSLRDRRVTATVTGVSRPERVAQTLEWAAWPIPDALWEELLALPYTTDDPEAARDNADPV